jgi:flavin reductase (DIM6/NTAB) family NADH-FMN oxidoreductase RutF
MEQLFEEVIPEKLTDNVFKLLGTDWMLITAGTPESFNTMTASWGGLGVLWNKNVSYCFIRPKRYTYEFIEKSEYYTFSFFSDKSILGGEEKYRQVLDFCGEHSGRDTDKIAKTGITPLRGIHNTVYFAEARLVIINRKLYAQHIDEKNFLDVEVFNQFYNEGNIHKQYIGEVVSVLQKKIIVLS